MVEGASLCLDVMRNPQNFAPDARLMYGAAFAVRAYSGPVDSGRSARFATGKEFKLRDKSDRQRDVVTELGIPPEILGNPHAPGSGEIESEYSDEF